MEYPAVTTMVTGIRSSMVGAWTRTSWSVASPRVTECPTVKAVTSQSSRRQSRGA